MGFFSSIVKFVKNIVRTVLGAIAKFMNSVFGSPVIAALAMLVLAVCLIGPMAFAEFLANPVLLLTPGTGWLLASLIANVLIQVVTLVCPSLGRALGYAFGLLSFFIGGLNLYTMYSNGTWTGMSLLATWTSGIVDLTATDMYAIFAIASLTSWTALMAGLAEGVDAQGNPKNAFVQGYVDGFFAVPGVAGDIADAAVSSATDSFVGLLALAGACYVGYKVVTKPSNKSVLEVQQPLQLELANGS